MDVAQRLAPLWQDYKTGVIRRVFQFTVWFDRQKRRDRGIRRTGRAHRK